MLGFVATAAAEFATGQSALEQLLANGSKHSILQRSRRCDLIIADVVGTAFDRGRPCWRCICLSTKSGYIGDPWSQVSLSLFLFLFDNWAAPLGLFKSDQAVDKSGHL
jgi:hypothetical protein